MPEPETRYPCPVCLGVKLSKIRLVATAELTLDRCERCGGIWFDEGEVARLRGLRFQGARQKIQPADVVFRMSCHGCQALMDRNAGECPVCGWKNVLDCPVCARTMERRVVEGFHLDFCKPCRGVWFDQIELAEIWNMRAGATEGRESGVGAVAGGAAEVGADVAEILFWNPELAVWTGQAVVGGARMVASGVSHLVTEAPQALGGALEATGNLAGSVFEAIAEVVGAVFD